MIYRGVNGPVDLEIEQRGNQFVVYPNQGEKLLLVDACNAVLDYQKVSGAKGITVTQPDGPTMNILSSNSRELFDSDQKYREAPVGAIYEISFASQGGR